MKRDLYLLLFLVLLSPMLWGQQRVFFSLNAGGNFYNAENSMKTIGDKVLRWNPGFSLAYETDAFWGQNMRLEYSYARSVASDVADFTVTDASGTAQVADFGADLTFSTHNLDLALCIRLGDSFTLAAGPTFSLVHRTIEIAVPEINGSPGRDFRDRLASLCAGVNAAASFQVPLQDGPQYLFFFSTVKLRYLHSVWFDKRGRNLDDYYQSVLLGAGGIGLGFAF